MLNLRRSSLEAITAFDKRCVLVVNVYKVKEITIAMNVVKS